MIANIKNQIGESTGANIPGKIISPNCTKRKVATKGKKKNSASKYGE
jgi:hypothetical protein